MTEVRNSLSLGHAVPLLVAIACFAATAVADPQVHVTRKTDHLVPSASEIDEGYRSLLSQKLFVTPASYARIVVLPSSAAGEVSIAIYSPSAASDTREASLTCTTADRNIWYSVSESNPNRGKEPAVQITRKDALLSKAAAVAVSEAIKEVLNRIQPVNRENRIILDGTDIEFSIEDGTQNPARGLLTPYAKGEVTDKLHRLVKLLTTYCDAAPVERQHIAREIQQQAAQLGQAVKQE